MIPNHRWNSSCDQSVSISEMYIVWNDTFPIYLPKASNRKIYIAIHIFFPSGVDMLDLFSGQLDVHFRVIISLFIILFYPSQPTDFHPLVLHFFFVHWWNVKARPSISERNVISCCAVQPLNDVWYVMKKMARHKNAKLQRALYQHLRAMSPAGTESFLRLWKYIEHTIRKIGS